MRSLKNIYLERQKELLLQIQISKFNAIALAPSASLYHLIGINFHSYERPILVLFVPHKSPIFILPDLEVQRTLSLPYPVQVVPYHDDPDAWIGAFSQAARISELKASAIIGVDPINIRWLEIQYLENVIPGLELSDAQEILSPLRINKDADEIQFMRKAVDIAQLALQQTLPSITIGMTERDLASRLTVNLFQQGSDLDLPFFPIVASGPNSANPHATPSDRKLSRGDLLIIDWGASFNGYISDLTRTFSLAKMDPEKEKIARIVASANRAGRRSAKPGIAAHEIDDASRLVITKAGYGDYFIHRTGHGIGLEAHEAPYIHSGNKLKLSPGMAFTIEPGIYFPGEGGVRIEDDVVITSDGAEILSTLPRDLQVVGI
jgi:Xaa-Pro dipeptidase